MNVWTRWALLMMDQAPLVLAGIIAIPLAIRLRSRAPRSASLAMVGAAVLVLTSFCCTAMSAYLQNAFVLKEMDVGLATKTMLAVNWGSQLGRVTGLALMVSAIFTDRTIATAEEPATYT